MYLGKTRRILDVKDRQPVEIPELGSEADPSGTPSETFSIAAEDLAPADR